MDKTTKDNIKSKVSDLKSKMSDVEWQSVTDIIQKQWGEVSPLDQFEWSILSALRGNKEFQLNKPYDLVNKGKGFKSGNIQLIRDTRDSKIFISSFHVNRPDGSNKLANITLYRFERKHNETSGDLRWEFDCKVIIDNPSERDHPVNRVFDYLKKQLSLDGHKLDSVYAKVIEGKTESEMITQQDILEKIKSLDDPEKLNDIVTALVQNEKVLLSPETYHDLLLARYGGQTIANYEKDLAAFKELISNPKTTETDMQEFLGSKEKDRSWFFGLDYLKVYPKFNPGIACEYDFLIRRFNLVYDIVELKGPNAKIIDVVNTASRGKPDPRVDYGYSEIFGRALHQVITYLQQYEETYTYLTKENPTVLNFEGGQFPRGKIVMSKRELIDDIGDIHKLNRRFSNIEVLTYDDLYERANNIVTFLKKIKDNTEGIDKQKD